MNIEKKIYDTRNAAKKIKFLTELQRRFEEAKSKGFAGDIDEFKEKILRKKYKDILIQSRGLARGGPVKPNGQTTFTSSDWDIILNENFPHEIFDDSWTKAELKTRPKKVAYKFGASSQAEEDLINREVEEWQNAINKGELDPSTTFMQYLDMILGRSGANRGGIISTL